MIITNDIPRRSRQDLMHESELAIVHAVDIIEGMDADVRLTEAINLLSQAREKVADYIDAKLEQKIDHIEHAKESVPTIDDEFNKLLYMAERLVFDIRSARIAGALSAEVSEAARDVAIACTNLWKKTRG